MSAPTEDEVLKTAKERYDIANKDWGPFYKESRETLKFIGGEQWDNQLRQNREDAGLPCLSANSLPTFLRQITNEARKNTPAIQIDPKDDIASEDNATIYADMIRGIEQHSHASNSYDIAGWYAAATGLGFIRIVSEYEDEESFFQKLVVKTVIDPEVILMDPDHKEPDASDMEWCFVMSTMTKEDYKRKFKNSRMSKVTDEKGWSDIQSQWVRDDQITIAEYYWKEYTPAILYKIYNTITGQTIIATVKPSEELVENGTLQIVKQRDIQEVTIRWAKINDMEILEETTWPGQFIPVIAVKGEETYIAGKRKLKGAVHDAIPSQRALNYFFSLQAELVSLAPKAPYVGAIGQFKNFEHLWRDANIAPTAYLPYNVVSEGGQVLPAPQRQTQEVPIQAAMSLCGQARDNMKAIFGIFDASMGENGNETSGVAILTRQQQSHNTTYHFYDNLVKAVQHVGEILVETIPTYYSDERAIQVIKRNGDASSITINRPDGEADLCNGKYGVVVETGPSYATRRQESVEAMTALGSVYPQAMALIADIIASESDWPGAKQVAARLRLALPPAIQQAEAAAGSGVSSAQQVQQLTQQVQQASQQLQLLTQQNQHADQLLKQAMEENKLLKTKSAVDLEKATMDRDIKEKQMRLDELTTELEYRTKQRELDLQEQQLKLQGAGVAIKGVQAMHDIDNDVHDRHKEHVLAVASDRNDQSVEDESDTGMTTKDLE